MRCALTAFDGVRRYGDCTVLRWPLLITTQAAILTSPLHHISPPPILVHTLSSNLPQAHHIHRFSFASFASIHHLHRWSSSHVHTYLNHQHYSCVNLFCRLC